MDLVLLRRRLSLISIFCIPLKLSWTYIFLTPAIFLLIYEYIQGKHKTPSSLKFILEPYFYFLLITCISCLFVLNPLFSLGSILKLIFLSLSILLYFNLVTEVGNQKLLLIVFSAQAIAAIHSIIEQAAKPVIGRWFIGAVSESGQLALASVVVAFIALESRDLYPQDLKRESLKSLLLFYCSMFFAFVGSTSKLNFLLSAILFITAFAYVLFNRKKYLSQKANFVNLNLCIFLPILITGLFSELKRGPIIGVFLVLGCYLFFHQRKLSIALATLIISAFIGFPELQTRFIDSFDHFFIRGGRYQMWSIGTELIGRYPFGLGHGSSEILRSFSSDIPPEHNHFHNNFLNILIETGWLPTLLLLVFFYRMLNIGFIKIKSPLAIAVGFGIVSSQIAGLVEYNLGDSEVLILMFFYFSILAAELYSSESDASNSSSAMISSIKS
jgi:hypothetical protein